jgi:serine/threonine protein kinase
MRSFLIGIVILYALSRLSRGHRLGANGVGRNNIRDTIGTDNDYDDYNFNNNHNDVAFGSSNFEDESREYSANRTTVGRFVRISHDCGYRIVREIGRGGNGIVFLAIFQPQEGLNRHNCSPRFVALKEPFNKLKAKLEISVLEQMERNEYMCEYIGAVADSRTHSWLLMFELCQHGSLRACLRDGTYPRGGEVIHNAITMMLKGVSHIHASNTAHRDIKMENFLISCECCEEFKGSQLEGDACRNKHRIKISDLGLAKSGEMMYDTSAQFAGTLCYVAPERLSVVRGKVTPASYELSDLYGAGLAAWELMYYASYGESKSIIENVFEYDTTHSEAQLLMCISLGGLNPDMMHLSPNIATWIQKCIAHDPKKRFQSLEVALKALKALRREFIQHFSET